MHVEPQGYILQLQLDASLEPVSALLAANLKMKADAPDGTEVVMPVSSVKIPIKADVVALSLDPLKVAAAVEAEVWKQLRAQEPGPQPVDVGA